MINIQNSISHHNNFDYSNRIVYTGVQFKDPQLLFYNTAKSCLVEDFHPMRGLIENGPYEKMYSPNGVIEDIKIAVVLPKGEKQRFAEFLLKLNERHNVKRNNAYVLPYPRFFNAYKIPLTISTIDNSVWQEFDLPKGTTNSDCFVLANNIIASVKCLKDSGCIVIIFIPSYLETYEKFTTDMEKFDLHDYVKAYSIPNNIPTQFVKEKTLEYDDITSVAWTLSLALYVKSGRTPWIINQLTEEHTAFVGIGYSIDPKNKNAPIVLGCSHIFSSDGQSIKYRLTKIKNPQFDLHDRHHENPFLTENEAYQLGCSINDMFRKSFAQYPKRIAIHKRTPFKQSEIDGLVKSFSIYGITNIDLLTITYEDSLRIFQLNDDLSANNYPVRRGIGFIENGNTMYLFTHGLANPINSDTPYVMGGKSLPIPLKITKYYGISSAEIIANDLLGLTRMNWNNFNLYSKLPCTIESSNSIARIGYLLSSYYGAEYDYRLFI